MGRRVLQGQRVRFFLGQAVAAQCQIKEMTDASIQRTTDELLDDMRKRIHDLMKAKKGGKHG